MHGMHLNSQIFREPFGSSGACSSKQQQQQPEQQELAAASPQQQQLATASSSKSLQQQASQQQLATAGSSNSLQQQASQQQLATASSSKSLQQQASSNSSLQQQAAAMVKIVGLVNADAVLPSVKGITNKLYEGGRSGIIAPLEHKLWQKHRDSHASVSHAALWENIPWFLTVDEAGREQIQSLLRLDHQGTASANELSPWMVQWEEAKQQRPPPILPPQRISLMSTFNLLPQEPLNAAAAAAAALPVGVQRPPAAAAAAVQQRPVGAPYCP